jgi:hypothetical protein
MSDAGRPLCPSAQPDWPRSVLVGVVGGTAIEPRLSFAREATPVSPNLLALTEPVDPTEVFRFAAPCLCSGCVHFQLNECGLARRIVQLLPAVVSELPTCTIRADCRWWQQEGRKACLRCPQVVTKDYNPSAEMMRAAAPSYGAPAT